MNVASPCSHGVPTAVPRAPNTLGAWVLKRAAAVRKPGLIIALEVVYFSYDRYVAATAGVRAGAGSYRPINAQFARVTKSIHLEPRLD
jgi:hypothetical protein